MTSVSSSMFRRSSSSAKKSDMFFSSELVLIKPCLASVVSPPLPVELEGEVGVSGSSSAHAQKSRMRSPGLLQAPGAPTCIIADKEDLLGSHPKRFPIAPATLGFGARRTMMSQGILDSGDDAASDTTE